MVIDLITMNNQRPLYWKNPLPLKNPGTPRLPRFGLVDRPFECAMTSVEPAKKPATPKFEPKTPLNMKTSDSNDSGIESTSSVCSSRASKGKALFQSATMLLACYMRVSNIVFYNQA
ncbi:uncharacterized protein CDAR_382571 [Caerostris darwini]|uniref:Uncharacterized protein n=1 Tax=Caerostris darwini TaxID=1538125 RepID=A0AAV4SNM7_9ARAC|nr:uncharacterized protein CDAR_382571 [Caerostris darwini]